MSTPFILNMVNHKTFKAPHPKGHDPPLRSKEFYFSVEIF